jgi:hypothetical protein
MYASTMVSVATPRSSSAMPAYVNVHNRGTLPVDTGQVVRAPKQPRHLRLTRRLRSFSVRTDIPAKSCFGFMLLTKVEAQSVNHSPKKMIQGRHNLG